MKKAVFFVTMLPTFLVGYDADMVKNEIIFEYKEMHNNIQKWEKDHGHDSTYYVMVGALSTYKRVLKKMRDE